MSDIMGIKQMLKQYHDEECDNSDLIKLYIRKLKESEVNICYKLKHSGDIPTEELTRAYYEVHKELFTGIEDIVELYK